MADKKTRASRRSIRKQRWAAVVAGIIAAGMLISSLFVYLGSAPGRNGTPNQNWTMEDYLEYYRQSAERLEEAIALQGPTVALLEALAESYNNLIMLQNMFAGGDSEDLPAIRNRLADIYRDLVELAPSEPRYRIELLHAYKGSGKDEETILEQALLLRDLLRESPKATAHLQLVNFLSQAGIEQLLNEEIAWLKDYLERRIENEEADNIERYSLAVLFAEFLNDFEAAYAQLDLILETEVEGGSLYNEVKRYRDRITAMQKAEESDME